MTVLCQALLLLPNKLLLTLLWQAGLLLAWLPLLLNALMPIRFSLPLLLLGPLLLLPVLVCCSCC